MTTSIQLQNRRQLLETEIELLRQQGCHSSDWSGITISEGTDLSRIRNVRFEGTIHLGAGVTLENIGLLKMEPKARCGVGSKVSVLDETGSRYVRIFPGLSAQIAMLAARDPSWSQGNARHLFDEHLATLSIDRSIGDNATIRNVRNIVNVAVDRDVMIDGASDLRNGMVINNAAPGRSLAHIGANVVADNFIIEDGCADSGAIIHNCYLGQGASLSSGFSAHDSLIFANCNFENGEAHAMFAGPFTASMHKSTLLIACQTSFFNAGSGTNQSNHMYKLGPVHWGVLERGVKTSSNSYLMLNAHIGAFSLLMGLHKTHPDASQFPFSYLFGDDLGATVVVPGAMLRSCGLLRDEKKWPARDRRGKNRLSRQNDRIIYDVFNPVTVEAMLSAIEEIRRLLGHHADDDRYIRHKGMKFASAALERAVYLYKLAVYKYLHLVTAEHGFPIHNPEAEQFEWVDMAGQIMPRSYLEKARNSESLAEIEKVFSEAFDNYDELQRQWISARFDSSWRRPAEVIADYAADFDRMIDTDRNKYLDELASQNEMLAL